MEDPNVPYKEFSNEFIHCTMRVKPRCVVEWTVKASPAFLKQLKERAARNVSKQVALPGFRKGKSPMDMILSKCASQIHKHTEELLIPAAYKECKSLISVTNIAEKEQFTYKMSQFSEEGATLLISFETAPQVPSIDLATFALSTIERPSVTEEKISEAIRQSLFFYAEWKPITERPVQEGDFVILNVDVIDEGTTPFSAFSHTRFEVKKASMSQWMLDAIQGKNTGESVEAISVADDDASEEEKLVFKPRKVRITIEKIEEAILPELTEEILTKLGASSAKDLEEKVAHQLNQLADEFVHSKQQEQVWAYLLQAYPFQIPATFVDKELSFRTQNLAKSEGFLEEWKSLLETEKQNLMKLLSERSEQSVRLSILCGHILREAKIRVPQVRDPMQYAEKMLSETANYVLSLAKQPAETAITQ